MDNDYNLHSAFDIEKHKQNFINYLEVLIDEDGTIMYAVPSHQEKAAALACKRFNINRVQLQNLCPVAWHGDYMTWLCIAARVVAVWNYRCVAVDPTPKQIGALRKLKMAGLYKGSIPHDSAEN